jgi:hypothetical protein
MNPYINGTPYTKSARITGTANTALPPGAGTKSTLRTAATRERIASVLIKGTQATTAGLIMFWRNVGGTYYFIGQLPVTASGALSASVYPFEQTWVPGSELVLENTETLEATTYNSETFDATTSYGVLS